MLKKLLLITSNPGKAAEFAALLPGVELDHLGLDLTEIQSLDPAEIGRHKALEALSRLEPEQARQYDAVMTDDTSLAFTALGGFPGPLVKYCLKALGREGLVRLLEPYPDKSAQAVCLLSLAVIKTGEVRTFEGKAPGRIGPPEGAEGFGWDPIFYPEGAEHSYAQLSAEEKNRISHRAVAVQALREWLAT